MNINSSISVTISPSTSEAQPAQIVKQCNYPPPTSISISTMEVTQSYIVVVLNNIQAKIMQSRICITYKPTDYRVKIEQLKILDEQLKQELKQDYLTYVFVYKIGG